MNIILLDKNERKLVSSDERYKHIKRILHMKEGDSFHSGEINGDEGVATIVSMNDKEIVLSFTPSTNTSSLYPITMIIAQVRPICMRRILREAVSLGIERIILPVSDLGEKSYSEAGLYTSGEYKSILLDGAMQSGKTGVSDCLIVSSVSEAIERAGEGEKFLLDNVIGAKSLSSLSLENKKVILAIGPERGWSERERELFKKSGYSPVLIGSRILRTETAAVAGASIALTRMGLM